MEMAVAAGATSAQGKRRFRAASNGFSLVCALVRPACRVAFAGLISFCFSGLAVAKDEDDSDNGSAKTAASVLPNLYLDLRTTYATVPANTLSIGLGNSALFAMLPRLSALPTFPTLPLLPVLPTVSSPSSQSTGVDLPLTVDLNDRLSAYGGISGTTSRTEMSDWSVFTITSWNVGFQADVYQQNGGSIPTVTLQSTVTRSIPDSLLATTSINTIAEFDYALNEDETRGLLAGVQYTRVFVDSALATVHPNIVGYVGGYYQWDNNWKFTGRLGIQSFGGAQIFNLTPFQPFTQPIVRLDLDRMDDNDNRLFGVTAQIAWVPKPSYQLTVRTPLYAIRN
jgi:opacity protein-like surface antigen